MYINNKSIYEREREQRKQEQLIQILRRRFKTYGYTKMKTQAFEEYDLYAKVNRSINLKKMIKVIDQTGNVLVLRPDMTLPMTRQIAQEFSEVSRGIKDYYIEDVVRQSEIEQTPLGRTQAGVEYYGNPSEEADAEVIALAIHILKDLGFKDIKVEMGDAGFFKALTQNMNLNGLQFYELKQLIQAKNAVDIERFLDNISVKDEIKQIVKHMPFLYGKPEYVLNMIRELPLTEEMTHKIDYLYRLVDLLNMYGLKEHLIIDLGLINQMDYYSDVIFQGFVERVGEPVMMGGRYNQLAESFQADIPAIGFACFIDLLVAAAPIEELEDLLDVCVVYEKSQLEQSIQLANDLRQREYRVITTENQAQVDQFKAIFLVTLKEIGYELVFKGEDYQFKDRLTLLDFIDKQREGI